MESQSQMQGCQQMPILNSIPVLCREVGGYQPMPLMEDVNLAQKLRSKAGQPVIIRAAVKTSSRRWQRLGYARATFSNLSLLCLYKLGVDPGKLAVLYYGHEEAAWAVVFGNVKLHGFAFTSGDYSPDLQKLTKAEHLQFASEACNATQCFWKAPMGC